MKPQDPQEETKTGTDIVAEYGDDNREVVNFDVKISGVKEDNTTPIPVEVFVGKGLANVKVYHKGNLISGTTYDSETGNATFNATTFSDYSFAYDVVSARIGEKTYSSLELAIAAAGETDEVVLLRDLTLSQAVQISKAVKINGDGKTLTLNYTGAAMTGNAIFNYAGGNEGLATGLTVSNLKMKMAGTSKNGFAAVVAKGDAEYTVAFDRCNFENMYSGVIANGCLGSVAPAISITNSVFEDVCYGVSFADASYVGTVTFSGNNMTGESGIQELFPGTSYLTEPTVFVTDGTYSVDPGKFVASGYRAGYDGTVYTISYGNAYVMNGEEKVYIDFCGKAATYTGDETYYLVANADGKNGQWIKTIMLHGNHTLQLNGYSVTNANLKVQNSDTLTIENAGTVASVAKVQLSPNATLKVKEDSNITIGEITVNPGYTVKATPGQDGYTVYTSAEQINSVEKITAAMANATSGDTISIVPGTYYFGSGLTIPEGVTISADGVGDVYLAVPFMKASSSDVGYTENNDSPFEVNKTTTYSYGFRITSTAYTGKSTVSMTEGSADCSKNSGYYTSQAVSIVNQQTAVVESLLGIRHDDCVAGNDNVVESVTIDGVTFSYTFICKVK